MKNNLAPSSSTFSVIAFPWLKSRSSTALVFVISKATQVMLLTVDPNKDFIDVKDVTATSMLSFQPTSINSSEFDTPKTD
jgi:hypothetical protein